MHKWTDDSTILNAKMTDNTQIICITCGTQTDKLYTRYKGDIIKIAHCVSNLVLFLYLLHMFAQNIVSDSQVFCDRYHRTVFMGLNYCVK